ncbi:MAG: DbpA RNA binding domain-containing protein [Spirochaetaceae bacterium]|nr:DbpA RNA binding domain-containing protein [Spirochaetaceae bacterium]
MYQQKIEENDKYSLIVKKAGFEALTPFQKKLVEVASGNKYIIAETKEGCGKTLGMVLPVITNTDFSFHGLKSIIIASSYESAVKINTLLKKLFQKKVTSLQSVVANSDRNIKKDSRMLSKQPDIFISTADSIIDQIRSNNISFEGIQSCIIEDSDIDDYYSFEKDIEFIFSKLSGKQLFIVFTKENKHNYSFYQLFKKPITINCPETGEEKIMDNSFIKNIVTEIKETSDIKDLVEIRKITRQNVPFFVRSYFSAWLLKKYAEQNGYNLQTKSNEEKNSDLKTIFINIGKNRRLYSKDIAGMVLSSKVAEKSDLKRIRVFDSYSFIDVTSSKAEAVIGVINNVTFKGKKLNADYAKKQQK